MLDASRRTSLLVAFLAAATLASLPTACTSGSGGRTPQFRGADGEPGLTITIRNQRTDAVRLWLWIDGARATLGSVQGVETEIFRSRLDRVSLVRLEFDVTLGSHCVTRTVSLEPGDRLDVTIPTNLRMMDVRCGG